MRLLPRRQRNRITMPPAADIPPAAEAAPAAGAPDPRCTSATRSGARCRLPAAPGTDRCFVHAPKPGPAAA